MTASPSSRYRLRQPQNRYAVTTSQTNRSSEPAQVSHGKPSLRSACTPSSAVWRSQPSRTPQVANRPAKGQAPLMIAGRTVLGLGAESMIVAVTTALAKWFKGKELSFAFGINLTIARIASVAADNSPTWANSAFYPQGPAGPPSWRGPLLIAVGAGVLSVKILGWEGVSIINRHHVNITPIVSLSLSLARAYARN